MNLVLAQGEYTFCPELPSPVLLVAGGRLPSPEWLRVVGQSMPVWAVDKGVESCRRARILPERVIGDADSGSPEDWEWAASRGVPVEHFHRDKEDTDLQLALKKLASRKPGSSVFLTGGLGGRFDHAYSNVFSLFQSQEWGLRAGGLVDEAEAVFLLEGASGLSALFNRPPSVISLLPCSATCRGVSLTGTKWPLTDVELLQDRPAAICNRLQTGTDAMKVHLAEGRLGVYFCWDEQGL